MAHPYYHAKSSARKYGGVPEDYLAIHTFFDSLKETVADARHRIIYHSTHGIFLAEKIFGLMEENRRLRSMVKSLTDVNYADCTPVTFERPSDGKQMPIRTIAEQHVLEDLGRIPTLASIIEAFPKDADLYRHATKLSDEE